MAKTLTTSWQEISGASQTITSNTTGYVRLYMKYVRYATYDKVYYEIRYSAYNPYGNYFAWEQNGNMAWSFSYAGQTHNGSFSHISITSNVGETTMVSGNMDVYHMDAYSSRASATCIIYKNSKTLADDCTLPLLAVPSEVSVSSDPTLGGNAVTITCSRVVNTYTHVVRVINPDNTSSYVQTFNDVGASTTWTPPLFNGNTPSQYTQLISGESRTFTIECETFNGSTSIGKKTCTTTIHVPNNSQTKPTMTGGGELNITETNTAIPAAWRNANVYVQSKSKLNFVVQAVTKINSTMGAAAVLIDGSDYRGTSSNGINATVSMTKTIQSSGTLPVKLNVSDSRGFKMNDSTDPTQWSTFQNLTVIKYISPSFDGEPQISRVNANGHPDDQGTYLAFTMNARISAITDTSSTHRNDVTFKIRWKAKDASTWEETSYTKSNTSDVTLNTSADDYILSKNSSMLQRNGTNITILANKAYDVEFQLIDTFNTSSSPIVSRAQINVGGDLLNFNVNGHALGIGQLSTASQNEEKLEVAYPTTFKTMPTIGGVSLLDIFYPVGSYYETSNTNFNPNTSWGGTWVEDSQGRLTLAAGRPTQNSDTSFGTLTNDQITNWWFNVGATYGEYQHTLSISEMPSHSHGGSTTWGGGHNHNAYFKEARQTNSYNFSNDFARGTSSGGDYNKQITTSGGEHSHGINAEGGGAVHNQVPPLIVVKRWHRTA